MRTTRWVMVASAVLSVVVAVAVPGYQTRLIVFGGVLIAWATFGLLNDVERTRGQRRRRSRVPSRRYP